MASILATKKARNHFKLQIALTLNARAFKHWCKHGFVQTDSAATDLTKCTVLVIALKPYEPSTDGKQFAEMDIAIPVPRNGEEPKIPALIKGSPHPMKTFAVANGMTFSLRITLTKN
jgi:hypothetical protein